MSIQIGNRVAAICSVDCSGPGASPATLPRFWGPGARQFANAGFGLFAATPAPMANSERLAAGIYRMHLIQPFTFLGGEANALATLNATNAELLVGLNLWPSIVAQGVDFSVTTDGCDVLVLTAVDGGQGQPPRFIDLDFTLWIIQYPQQQTN